MEGRLTEEQDTVNVALWQPKKRKAKKKKKKKNKGSEAQPSANAMVTNNRQHPVLVQGYEGGFADVINGIFDIAPERHNGSLLYQKRTNSDVWLRYSSEREWLVSYTTQKDSNSTVGMIISKEKFLTSPMDAVGWTVTAGEAKVSPCFPGGRPV